jgi:UDPglucose--hexose-1-phosphate uridylyltransferase
VPEVRVDPLSGLKVVVAGERASRPGGGPTTTPADPIDAASDPFAEGHEDRTPPELHAVRPGGGGADTPGWRVRVVPNL